MLLCSKDINTNLADSYLLKNNSNHKSNALLFGLLFPVTIIFLLKNNKMKNFKMVAILAAAFLLTIGVVNKAKDSYNISVDISGEFNANHSNRGATFDKMKKVVSEKLQVAGLNDTSYSRIALAIASSRKDGEGLLWKWAHEQNANINYSEVSALYKDLSSSVLGLRNELQTTELAMQKNVKDWYVLHRKFPTNLLLFYQETELPYTPILSDESRITNTTGVDNNYKIK